MSSANLNKQISPVAPLSQGQNPHGNELGGNLEEFLTTTAESWGCPSALEQAAEPDLESREQAGSGCAVSQCCGSRPPLRYGWFREGELQSCIWER